MTALPALALQLLEGVPRDGQAELVKVLAGLPTSGADGRTVHEAMHLLHLAGRQRHARTPSVRGVVARISTSGGGVPKQPTDRADVGFGGLAGDSQQNRRHHGRPWQAVCLWSAEVIEQLQAEGHPIGFGSAGENLTVRGLDWSLVSPGLRLQVGSAVLQVSSYAIPCVKNARWFSDGDFSRLSRPGGSRVYACVLAEGAVRAGDAVVVEPSVLPARDEQGLLPL
jgi:MOSC domain-containing protein YiiM